MSTTDALSGYNLRSTSQSERARADQVANSAGGFSFGVSPTQRLRRFLILGTDGGSYYAGQRDLTRANADAIVDFVKSDGTAVVDEIVEISTSGRAPRQNPALFALALAASVGDTATRRYALDALPKVARTATHLFLFLRYAEQFRSWGRALRTAVAGWYTSKEADALAYQMVKYRNREGWTHRDVLRQSHAKGAATSAAHDALFGWATKGTVDEADIPALVLAYETAQTAPRGDLPGLIRSHGLSWEMLPTDALTDPQVWEALLDRGMPQTALIRNLSRLTSLGLLTPMSSTLRTVVDQITDQDRLVKARVHPLNVLTALRTYESGRGMRGSGSWTPVPQVVDALDEAFYLAFGAVTPANKRTMLALDVSGSMTWGTIAGSPLTPRDASAALALVTAATERDHMFTAFSTSLKALDISPKMRLSQAISRVSHLPFGGTDCAQPMLYAKRHSLEVDTFVVLTDSETWAGRPHPFQALRDYRQASGIDARLVVVGMVANEFTIADPSDAGMLDVVGFDTATPDLISAFSRGEI